MKRFATMTALALLALTGCRTGWTIQHRESLSLDRNCHCQEAKP